MHDLLNKICAELDQLAAAVGAIGDARSFNIAYNNWALPGLNREEIAGYTSDLSNHIRSLGKDEIGVMADKLADWPQRLALMRQNTVGQMWGNPTTVVPAYLSTLQTLRHLIAPALLDEADSKKELTQTLKDFVKTGRRVRALIAQLDALEPKTSDLSAMVKRIEDAFETADELPLVLESLNEIKMQIISNSDSAALQIARISNNKDESDNILKILERSKEEAGKMLTLCEEAYSAATSQGLAAAFDARARALGTTVWIWSATLIVTLGAGSYLGYLRLNELAAIARDPNVSGGALFLNITLSFFTVGAPIWIGWLATKQIGQRFRLQEDYAFKASISKAYDGYRKQAASLDEAMARDLLASALKRLDEEPLRHVEQSNHGSPLHEALESRIVGKLISILEKNESKRGSGA